MIDNEEINIQIRDVDIGSTSIEQMSKESFANILIDSVKQVFENEKSVNENEINSFCEIISAVPELNSVFEDELSKLSDEDFVFIDGLGAIIEVLNRIDLANQCKILKELEKKNPKLAEKIKKKMFVFEDIALLSDKDIQRVLRDVDSTELAKALKGVNSEVQDKIYRNMSKRSESVLKEDMDLMGAVPLKDVEEAQQKIVGIIRRLEDNGEIIVARAGEDELVV